MFADLLVVQDKERENKQLYRVFLSRYKQARDKKRELEQEDGYFENILEEVDAARATQRFEMPRGAERRRQHRMRRHSVDSFIYQAYNVEKLENVWKPCDVARLKHCIETVGLDPVLLQIMMPERTYRSIRRRLRLENPEELLQLSQSFVQVPEDVQYIYYRLIGERDVNLDIGGEISGEGGEIAAITAIPAEQRQEVQNIFDEFVF